MIQVSRKKMFRRRRALLTMAAVAISMSLLVSMLSIAQGISDFSIKEVEGGREDVLITTGDRHGISNGHEMTREMADMEDVAASMAILNDFLSLNISGKRRFALAEGIVPDHAWQFIPEERRKDFDGWFEEGGDPHYGENYTAPFTGELLISRSLSEDFGLERGDRINLSRSSNGLEYTFTVKAIFKTEFSGEGIFSDYYFVTLHLSELQTILNLDVMGKETMDVVDSIAIYLDPDVRTDKEEVSKFVEKVEDRYPIYRGSVRTKEDRIDDLQSFVSLANGFNMGIGIVSVMIGVLFVTCVMVISVYERTPIIGTMRAIGISKRTIFFWTFREALGIVSVGSLLGLLPGYLISDLLGSYFASSYGLSFNLSSFTPVIALESMALTVTIGTLVSLVPAWMATRMNVVQALRYTK